MSVEERLRLAADEIAAAVSVPPVEAVRARAWRRRMRVAVTAAGAAAAVGAVVFLAWPGSSGTRHDRVIPVAPSPAALDFTATVLPPGLSYRSTEHGPPNEFEEVIKRYFDSTGSHVLIIDVNRGRVMTPAFYAETGGFTLTTVDGHPAAVGADHGRNAAGNAEAFVQISPTVTIDVEDRGGLTLAQVLDVLRGIRVN